MDIETIAMDEHRACSAIQEHGQGWIVCDRCGAQWSLPPGDFSPELVSEGDGFCAEHAS